MKGNRGIIAVPFVCSAAIAAAILLPAPASAHCDGMDGPVVKAAQEALAKGDVTLVLIWVRKDDENEVRRAFDQTMHVRKAGSQARDLADMYFFETLVRLHRAGEGVAYTGLKPAGRDLGPAIPAADHALKAGDVEPLTNLLIDKVRAGLRDRYAKAVATRSFKVDDVEAGREHVEAYVTYVHYVEGVYEAAMSAASGHAPDESKAPQQGKAP